MELANPLIVRIALWLSGGLLATIVGLVGWLLRETSSRLRIVEEAVHRIEEKVDDLQRRMRSQETD